MKLISLKDEISAAMATKPSSVWPIYSADGTPKFLDRNMVMTASEAATCIRKLWYDKNAEPIVGEDGAPVQEVQRWGFFERGHNVEAWIVQKLNDAGTPTQFTGEYQVSFMDGLLSGTPDGVALFTGEAPRLLEFKSMDPRTNTRFLPRSVHITQCQVNMGLLRDMLFPDMEGATLLYVNASDYQEMYEFDIDFDPAVYQWAKDRAVELFSAESAEDLSPEGVLKPKATGGCTYCTHTAMCSGAVKASKAEKKMHATNTKLANKVF